MANENPKIDIKNFQSYSSTTDLFRVLMVDSEGADASITIALLRTQLAYEVKPAIIDGVWWIGSKNTQVDALGKTPILRLGETGVEWKWQSEADTAWRLLVTTDALRLKFEHLTTEQKRELIPHLSDFTPAEVEELQKPAKDMIGVLNATNKSVSDAEVLRNQAEVGRDSAESDRVTKESNRQNKETERNNSEWARNRSETERQAQEGNRSSAEAERVKNELARQKTEEASAAAEVIRVANENIRLQAEKSRAEAERSRVTVEGNRVTAETGRATAEQNRVTEHGALVTATNKAKDASIAETVKTVQATKEAVAATGLLQQTIEDAVAATELAEAAAGSVEEAKQAALSAAGNANDAATTTAEKTALAITATGNANAAAQAARETAEHPNYVGADFYVYRWNSSTKAYDKTDVYVKGEGFSIRKTYTSVELMHADIANPGVAEGAFVMVNTGDVEDPDNAQVYVKTKKSNGTFTYEFLVDMSGAIGFTGKTPQLITGNVTTGTEGSAVAFSLSERPDDANGNPVYAVNISIPRGDKGKVPVIEIGTVTTGVPGSSASAALIQNGNTATGEPKFKLNMSIPQGLKGEGNFIVAETGLVAGKRYLFVPNADNSASGKFVEYVAPTVPEQVQPDWNATTGKGVIANKPNVFTPSAHGHAWDDISGKPTSMPASDVPSWAKAAQKPSYSASEVGAAPSNHNHSGTYEPVFNKKGAFNKDFGTTPGTVCQGSDARLSDARTPLAHGHAWDAISGKPSTFPPAGHGHSWDSIANKPLAFTPVAHGHAWDDISGKPTSMPASDVPLWAKAANKPSYTATEVGAIEEAPRDGKSYARRNGQWTDASNLPVNSIMQTTPIAGNIFGSKWLKCDGSIVSKLDYPLLKASGALTQPWNLCNGGRGTDITYSSGLFVCVGTNSECYWSTDGKLWTVGRGISANQYLRGVTYGNGLFVCAGNANGINQFYWSVDGKTWTAGTSLSGSTVSSIAYGNGLFVGVGSSDNSYWSSDGKSWNIGGWMTSSMNNIIYANGHFVCVGGSGRCQWSVDGKTWTAGSGMSNEYYLYKSAYGNGLFVCVGKYGANSINQFYWSVDGKTWTAGMELVMNENLSAITFGNGLFVCACSTGGCYYSGDGKSWTEGNRVVRYDSVYSVTYGNGLFVCAGSNNNFYCTHTPDNLLLPTLENSFIKALE